MKKPKRSKQRPAFMVIASAEGRRTVPREEITAAEYERQRDEIAKAGIGRIRRWWE